MSDGTRPRDGQPPGILAPGPSQPGAHHLDRPTAVTAAAYAAAITAFAYALMSLYWALGTHGLISTVGGYVAQFAHQKDPAA